MQRIRLVPFGSCAQIGVHWVSDHDEDWRYRIVGMAYDVRERTSSLLGLSAQSG